VIPTLGNFVQRHAEAIASIHNVSALYITARQGQTDDFVIEDNMINGVMTTIVYYAAEKNGFVTKWRAFQKGIGYLKSKHRFHFDLVHFNVIWNAGWQAVWLKKRYGLPYLISENYTGFDTTSRSDQPKGLKPFSKIVTRNAAFVCPVTMNLQQVMLNYGLKGNYSIVPNVVNTDMFQLHAPKPDSVRFLHISTLNDAHKNISGMLRCWKKCSDIYPHIHLQIGGDGPVEHFRKMANELQIRKDSISFFGEKTPPEVASLMQESDCLLMFSNYENLPLVIIEALASGMAIISTNAGGVAEHIDNTLGYVINKRDEEALVASIVDYVKDPSRFKPELQRKYAVEHFSIPSIARQFDALYQKMI
jgi:glycosyltransferase involved in cell wall biosynthesis